MSLLPNENCHFSAVNSESGANATSPAAMATASNEPTHFFARSASDFAVRACGFSPPAASQALYPGQVLSEYLGRSGGHRAARLVELGAKRPDLAAELRQAILVLEDALDAGAKPILGRSGFVPSLPLRGQLRQPQLDDRLANLVLGLEVIIDVAERNLGFARDVV